MCKIRWHKSVSVNIIIGIYYRFSVIICITFHVTSHSLFSLLQERDHPMTFINPNTAKLELCLHYLVNLCCPLNTYNEFVHVKDYLLHLLHIWFGCCGHLDLDWPHEMTFSLHVCLIFCHLVSWFKPNQQLISVLLLSHSQPISLHLGWLEEKIGKVKVSKLGGWHKDSLTGKAKTVHISKGRKRN